jgi:hypothetical protein
MRTSYIPFEPPEPNSGFIIFQSPGSGYYPKGCGPRCAFITKEDDALVPSQEIEKLLMFLKISTDKYLEVRSGLSPEPEHSGKTDSHNSRKSNWRSQASSGRSRGDWSRRTG